MARSGRLVVVVLSVLSLVAVTQWRPAAQAAASQVSPSDFVRVYASGTPGLADPIPLQTKNPVYTPEAMRQKVAGEIQLQVTIDAAGKVRDALVTKSLDSKFGLDDAAVVAASEWTFRPGRLNGQAVPVRTTLTMSMRLH